MRQMMHGFGDEKVPLEESVDLMEQMVVEFIAQMVGTHFPLFFLVLLSHRSLCCLCV